MSFRTSTLTHDLLPPPHICSIAGCSTTLSAAYENELRQKIKHHIYTHHKQLALPNQFYCKICSHLMTAPSSQVLKKVVKTHKESHEGASSQRKLREIKGRRRRRLWSRWRGRVGRRDGCLLHMRVGMVVILRDFEWFEWGRGYLRGVLIWKPAVRKFGNSVGKLWQLCPTLLA